MQKTKNDEDCININYKIFEKTIIQTPYHRTMDNMFMENDDINNFQDEVKELIKKLSKTKINKYIRNKIVVDAGSGLGKFFPLLSFFKPEKIISVERDPFFIQEQKKFVDCIFPYLPNKKICDNLVFYNENMEDFIERELQCDTIFFFQNWNYMNFTKIANITTADLIFFTKLSLSYNVYDFLKITNYSVVDEIKVNENNDPKNYFFLIAKKLDK